jgi:TolA-binding protein
MAGMRSAFRGLALGLVLALGGCGGGAEELMETAAFEELQNNPAHARQLYQRVVDRYPGTPEAEKAAERLRALAPEP